MRNVHLSITMATVLTAGLLLATSGCELRTSGAAATTTVTLKLSEDETSDSGGGENGGEQITVAGFGTFSGRVVFQGNAPQLAPIHKAGTAMKDTICAAVDMPNERLVVGAGSGVENVFIYLEKVPRGGVSGGSGMPEGPAIFDQKGCKFLPHALLVRAGQTIKVLNSDPVLHNTHNYPNRNPIFNKGVLANNQTEIGFAYAKAEKKPLEVKCDIHSWMLAYHLPLDHPYAAVTKPDGSFEIPQVPAGTHKFRVWHEAATGGFLNRKLSVTITPDETTKIEIPYPAARFVATERPDTKSIRLSFLLKGEQPD